MKKEILDRKIEALRKNTISTTEYRSRITERVVQKQTESDLRKSQKICEHLDVEKVCSSLINCYIAVGYF